ncbi:hypothetical protein ACQPU1_00085 [Clostridium paraputrificum]|uniref:hypothetical protein n=1 Tax=Clostridium TaxID=1485 RepID=UPI003D3556C5
MKHNSNESSNNFKNYNISSDDMEELRLLNIQLGADIIAIISDILSYTSTRQSIDLVYSKYNGEPGDVTMPDVTALESLYVGLIARFIYTEISFIRYDHLYEKYMNGEIEYSLQPDLDIINGNMLRNIGVFYSIRGAWGIYDRDTNQPVFGI